MAKGDRLYSWALKEGTKSKPNWNLIKNALEQALQLGNPKAAYALATWYLHGRVYKKDLKRAIQLLRMACDGNVPEAHFDLAICYEKGKGIKKNLPLAFKHYLIASLLGDREALYEVGRCYHYGIGIKTDKVLARIWISQSNKKTN
jgi:TPR repeat protein